MEAISGQSISNLLNQTINQFNDYTKQTDSFILVDQQKSRQFTDLTKCLYDLNKRLIDCNSSVFLNKKSLNELHIKDFDEEQVWQQIELENEPMIQTFVKQVANIAVKSNYLRLNLEEEEEEILKKEIKSIEKNGKIIKSKHKKVSKAESYGETKRQNNFENKSGVDDMFFKLNELEKFLDSEDLKEEKMKSGIDKNSDDESDDEIDYFADDSSESGNENKNNRIDGNESDESESNLKNAMFGDFFDDPNDGQHVEEEESSGDEEVFEADEEMDTRDIEVNDLNGSEEIDIDEDNSSDSDEELDSVTDKLKSIANKDSNEDENKSEFERIQELLKQRIAKQERENLSSKSWQMSGEIVADKRPENSILEEHLQFDHISRPAPMITEETTVKLEEIIKQRIKDNSYDDVERKVKPKEKPFEFRRRITMESEKNKRSLAEVYENEFSKQQQQDKEEKENPEHIEIKKLLRNLSLQLDALSNFNYTPRPPQPEIRIINNLPAITVEEVTPMGVSDVSLLAPQEVFNTNKRELQTTGEKSKTDRKRARKMKKKMQRNKQKFDEKREKQTIKVKNVTKSQSTSFVDKSSEADNKALKSSKTFFERLEEKTKQLIPKVKQKKSISKSVHLKL